MSDDALRAAMRRSAWVPVAIGGAGSAITGVWLALSTGVPYLIAWNVMFFGSFGVLAGVIILGIGLATAALRAAQWLAPTLSVALALGLGLLGGERLGAGWMLVALIATASAASIAHVAAAHRQANASDAITATEADQSADRPSRIAVLLAAGALGVVLSLESIGMLRQTLHVGCSYGSMGEGIGTWVCADGIGYIFYGVALLFCAGLPLLTGALTLIAATPSRGSLGLHWLAAVPAILTAALLASLTLPRTDRLPAGETWPILWTAAVGIPLMLALLGTVCVAVSDPASGVASRVVLFGGATLLLAAFVLQPGLGPAVCAAGGLLAAARIGTRAPATVVSEGEQHDPHGDHDRRSDAPSGPALTQHEHAEQADEHHAHLAQRRDEGDRGDLDRGEHEDVGQR